MPLSFVATGKDEGLGANKAEINGSDKRYAFTRIPSRWRSM